MVTSKGVDAPTPRSGNGDTLVIHGNFAGAGAPTPRSGITVNSNALLSAGNFKGADGPTPRSNFGNSW